MAKKYVKYVKTGAYTASEILWMCLRAALAVIMIAATTMTIFGCIFIVYVKTNLSGELGLTLEDFSTNLSSVIYYMDPETGAPVELTKIQALEYRVWLEYDEIPLLVEQALVAIEDHRFYQHYGVDWYRTSGAFVNMFAQMRDNFGGSTITQQLIKNMTLEDDITVQRKFQEIFRALDLEKKYSKEEIIQWYLNKVYFGRGSYGIGAAADKYFGKAVSQLTLAEIASLIAIPNSPSYYNPYSYPENNKERQEDVLDAMFVYGYIDEAQLRAAKAQELVFKQGEHSINEQVVYTWFEEAVIAEVVADFVAERGISEKTARDLLSSSGYNIYTTFNPDIQQAIDDVYLDVEGLPETTGTTKQLQSAMMIVDPYTGHIQGLTGGVGEKTENLLLNRATMTRRPPGSSIKPIAVYAPAMDAGLITPDTRIDDSADVVLAGRSDDWLPRNDDRSYRGVISVRTAITSSRNVISAQVLDWLTPEASYRFLTDKLGIVLDAADMDYAPLSLGQLSYGATVQEMASAYTMFVNNGMRVEAITYTHITDNDGVLVFENRPIKTVAISEKTAYWMTSILRDAVASGGTGASANLGNVMPSAGKTGTASDTKDRWFCGYTPYYVGITWSGYDMPETIRLTRGGNPSAQIWKRVMTAVHEDLEYKQFTEPADVYLTPVPGIKDVSYTVQFQNMLGTVFQEQTLSAPVGSEVEYTAPQYEGFEIVGDAMQTITLNENAARNVMVFKYAAIAPEPTPTPIPTPTPDIFWGPQPTIDPFVPPDDGLSTPPPPD